MTKLFARTLKFSIIGITILTVCIISFITIFYKFFYYHELDYIKKSLQKNKNVEIVKIWGNEDVTFEDIYAILNVKNKGILSIHNLSEDVNNFPDDVYISRIGHYTFVNFLCKNAISWSLNIGSKSDFGKKTGITFHNVDDIINHYDDILAYVNTCKKFPAYNYLDSNEGSETILFVDKGHTMNHRNLKTYYNSECVADLLVEINKTWKSNNCR